MSQGVLYICGTPIGNLEDLSYRAYRILKEADLIACEDTRRTQKLLNHYEIEASLSSYHEHNEREKTPVILSHLQKGEKVVLVSDAGMPGVSDPGQYLIDKVQEENISIQVVPGATAAISALVLSGLKGDRFVFEGFLPRSGKEREARLAEIQNELRTVLLYEAPHRLQKTLSDLVDRLGNRRLAIARELTKVHEEVLRGSAEELLSLAREKELKGEIVIIIEGREEAPEEKEGWEELSIVQHVELLMENGYTKKKAIKEVARIRDLPKSEVYEEAIVISASPDKKNN